MKKNMNKKEQLQFAVQKESKKFEEYYLWIENHLPASFFEDADADMATFVAHSLMGFDLQDYFSQIHFKNFAIALCLDSPDADLQILKHYRSRGIKDYRTFVSNVPPPFPGIKENLRVAIIYFTEFSEEKEKEPLSAERQHEIYEQVKARNPNITEIECNRLLSSLSSRFIRSLAGERLAMAINMFFHARTEDPCQYDIRRNNESPSLQIVLAWRNVPKHDFLYRLAKVVRRHGLALKRMSASYADPYSKHSVLLMSLGLDGESDLDDFLQELVTVKYFPGQEAIETTFVDTGLVRGNIGNYLKTMVFFIHQVLLHADPYFYSFSSIEEGLCRHPELTVMLTEVFEAKFHPTKANLQKYDSLKEKLLSLVEHIDTGNDANDTRRKNILKQGLSFIEFCLKTNFYRKNKTAFSFRLDPRYLDNVPFNRKEKFPELPYAIFLMKGLYYLGFHIRFRDLSRGGLRTVYPEKIEQLLAERNNTFSECYGLALTQQKKNKDIPEGGSKGVILLEPYERLISEEEIYQRELEYASVPSREVEERIKEFHREQKWEYLYQAQRSYIESFVTLLNCEPDGTLRAKHIVDYYKKPEYIYLGPDENMHDAMITWISAYAKHYNYKPGLSFMTSKPGAGINHKEFGVTSRGVNVCMEEVLKFLDIDPTQDIFTIKMSGGPDGDVAGNQMYNLYRFYPKTAKLLTTIDVSGTIYDPNGLDLSVIAQLFKEGKPIRFYPAEKLSEGGFLLDAKTKREQSAYVHQTLLIRKIKGKIVEEWLSGNEMNHILRTTVHQTKADIFVPGGGRPRTLNDKNWRDYLDEAGKPTSRAIVEGANLYLTPLARRELEKLGVIIIKDSTANKGGVICSSMEVLEGLILSEEEFLAIKTEYVDEVLETICDRARDETRILLKSKESGFLTDISEHLSERINQYTDELLIYLAPKTLSDSPDDPLIRCLLNYCPPILRERYPERILKEMPDIHKKAIIASFLGQRLVYRRGLEWSPSIVDILPLIVSDPMIVEH